VLIGRGFGSLAAAVRPGVRGLGATVLERPDAKAPASAWSTETDPPSTPHIRTPRRHLPARHTRQVVNQ